MCRGSRSVYSRLHCRLHIAPLVPDDTAAYVQTRLTQAGCDRDVFTHDALSYGEVGNRRQGEIILGLRESRRPEHPQVEEIARAVARELRSSGPIG